jgi:hypothetical protein
MLQTGRPSSTAWESRDTCDVARFDLLLISEIHEGMRCGRKTCRSGVFDKAPGIHTFHLDILSSASGPCAGCPARAKAKPRQKRQKRQKDYLHSLIRRSLAAEHRRRIRQSEPQEPTQPLALSWIRHAEKPPMCTLNTKRFSAELDLSRLTPLRLRLR